MEKKAVRRKSKKKLVRRHRNPSVKWKAPSGKVKLKREFWGHKKGTKGRISGGKLRLRGSPSAKVYKRDEGKLYSRRNPVAPGRSHMISPFRMPRRNPVSSGDMELMNRLAAKMNRSAKRAGRTSTDTLDLSPSERTQYRALKRKFDAELTREFPRYYEGMGGSPSYNPKTMKNYVVKEMMPDWKRKIDPRSIRTKMIMTKKGGKRLIRIGCPKGEWLARQKRCKVGTRAISMLTPKSEKILSLSKAVHQRVKAGNPGRIHAGMIVQVAGTNKKGRIVMPSAASGYWVLNMGGPHGTPKVVHESNIITRGKTTNPGLTIKQAKQQMPAGYVLSKDEAGDYVVKKCGAPESQWYFTDDLQDALGTAREMERREEQQSRSRLAKRSINPHSERSRMATPSFLPRRRA